MKALAVNRKRLVIRGVLIVLLVVLCFALYYAGKEHEILLDNKAADIDGVHYEPLEYVRVSVKSNVKPITLSSGERGAVKISGPRHTIKAEVIDRSTGEITERSERSLNFGKISTLVISVPALTKNATGVYLPLPGKSVPTPPPLSEPTPPSAESEAEPEVPSLSDGAFSN